MATSRTVIVAGAGIGGLTAALALARQGFRAVVIEQSKRLEEIGAGIQLSPNASRVLLALGLGEALKSKVVAPDSLAIRSARSGREIVRMPLGEDAEFRFGAPYWMIHRADLQTVLLDAARDNPDVTLKLGTRVEDFAIHRNGVTAQTRKGATDGDERGIALVGATGLWSNLRQSLGDPRPAIFRRRTAWRATLPEEVAPEEFRAPRIHLWLGRNSHLVHYPVRGGALINVVAIVRDRWQSQNWNEFGARDEILARFGAWSWARAARELLAIPGSWTKWALHDRPVARHWSRGPVTLLGDAAHPMLPFLAQGAAMAIEDAAVLAQCMAGSTADVTRAFELYEGLRRARTLSVQRAAQRMSQLYHMSGPMAFARNAAMRRMGGERLRARYDWLYDWRPD